MEKLTVCRTHRSPYQASNFEQREKEVVESLGHQYTTDINQANVLITNTHTSLSQLDLSKIKLIIHPNSGFDNFSIAEVLACPCPIILGNPVRAQAVSNYILSALFQHACAIPHHQQWDKGRVWPRPVLDQLKVQIIGHGHIGQIVSRTLSPLVKELMIYDPFKASFNRSENLRWADADVIIFACGLNSSSKKMLNKEVLAKLKSNVLIINPARGELIDLEELLNFCQKHPQSFAYLDVFPKEPAPLEKWQRPNLHLSSHIAGVSTDLDQRILNYVQSVLCDYSKFSTSDFKQRYHHLILQNLMPGEWT